MRKTFFDTLVSQAKIDDLIYLLVADIGFGYIEEFKQEFPKRFINCGIAEQNMIGVAAGLAICGKKVFVYSIANFVTMRCFEQIRNCIAYENLPVTIVGYGGKNAYPGCGVSHNVQNNEDIKIMECIPMEIHVPKTKEEVITVIKTLPIKPRYIRLSCMETVNMEERLKDNKDGGGYI